MSQSGVRRAAHNFTDGTLAAPSSRDDVRVMPALIKSGKAASLRRGVVHHVYEAAIVTDGKHARLAATWACGGASVEALAVADADNAVVCAFCAEAIHQPRGPVVYRCIDGEGDVIYIGSTINLHQRVRAHRGGAYWFDEVVDIDAVQYPTESAARLAEAKAIRAEKPFYNRDGVPARPPRGSCASGSRSASARSSPRSKRAGPTCARSVRWSSSTRAACCAPTWPAATTAIRSPSAGG